MKKHIHKYHRTNIAGFKKPPYLVYNCILPGCSHFIPVKLAFGKIVLCNRCGESMIMSKENIQQAKPHCDECTKKKPATIEREDKLEQLFRDLTKG